MKAKRTRRLGDANTPYFAARTGQCRPFSDMSSYASFAACVLFDKWIPKPIFAAPRSLSPKGGASYNSRKAASSV